MNPLLVLVGCAPAPTAPATPEAPIPERQPMDPVRLARRLSLDLRGRPPTIQEFDRVIQDPAQIETLVEDWLHDPAFADRIVSLYSEVYLTRTEDFPFSSYDLHVDDEVAFDRALGEEPLRIVARVATEDLPY